MKQGKTVVASLLIVFVTLGLDQWTKWAIVKSIKLNETVEMINHFFYLTYVQNTGAGFSMFAQAGMGFFAALTLIALVAMVYMFFKTNDSRYQICLSLVFSGAIGNFIDRVHLGYAVDMVQLDFIDFAIFNVADSYLTVGVLLLILILWKEENGSHH